MGGGLGAGECGWWLVEYGCMGWWEDLWFGWEWDLVRCMPVYLWGLVVRWSPLSWCLIQIQEDWEGGVVVLGGISFGVYSVGNRSLGVVVGCVGSCQQGLGESV